MAINATLPVESIGGLADDVLREAANLESALGSLRARCQRDPSFTGTAATRYDEYMARWDQHQAQLLEALRGAGNLLKDFHTTLAEHDDRAGAGFSV